MQFKVKVNWCILCRMLKCNQPSTVQATNLNAAKSKPLIGPEYKLNNEPNLAAIRMNVASQIQETVHLNCRSLKLFCAEMYESARVL